MDLQLSRLEFLRGLAAAGAITVLWGADSNEQVIPFLDSKPFNPEKPNLPWDQLTSWITPGEHFFSVAHYGMPEVDTAQWDQQRSRLPRQSGSCQKDLVRDERR